MSSSDIPSLSKPDYEWTPEGHEYQYVPENNTFMNEAKIYAIEHSLDDNVKTASMVVVDGVVRGRAANGSDYHKTHGCERVRLACPSGIGYEKCEGCHPKNHSEGKAMTDAHQQGFETKGADLYLWGHFWCCKPCWEAMLAGGIKNVYLLQDCKQIFDVTRKPKVSRPEEQPKS